jgi:hypothetical protein
MPPRSCRIALAACGIFAMTCSSSIRPPAIFCPVITAGSKVITSSTACVCRCQTCFLCSTVRSLRLSTSSASMAPMIAEYARSATSCTGAVRMKGARGRQLISSATSISSAPKVVFAFFFGTSSRSSRISRSRVKGSIAANSVHTICRNHSAPASRVSGVPGTSARRS